MMPLFSSLNGEPWRILRGGFKVTCAGSELGTLWPPSPASREHRKHLVGKGLDRNLEVLLTLDLPLLPTAFTGVCLSISLPLCSPDTAGLFGPRQPPRQLLLITQPMCGRDGLVPTAHATCLLPCGCAYGSKEMAPAFSGTREGFLEAEASYSAHRSLSRRGASAYPDVLDKAPPPVMAFRASRDLVPSPWFPCSQVTPALQVHQPPAATLAPPQDTGLSPACLLPCLCF